MWILKSGGRLYGKTKENPPVQERLLQLVPGIVYSVYPFVIV